jgi:hypothetical protein
MSVKNIKPGQRGAAPTMKSLSMAQGAAPQNKNKALPLAWDPVFNFGVFHVQPV